MQKIRQILVLLLVILLVVFIFSNLQSTTIQFFSLNIEAPLAVVMFVCAALGALCMKLIGLLKRGRKKKNETQSPSPDPSINL